MDNPIIDGNIGQLGYITDINNQSYALGLFNSDMNYPFGFDFFWIENYGNLLFYKIPTSEYKITLKNGSYFLISYNETTDTVYVDMYFGDGTRPAYRPVASGKVNGFQHMYCFFGLWTNWDLESYAGVVLIAGNELPKEGQRIPNGSQFSVPNGSSITRNDFNKFVNGAFSDIPYDGDNSNTGGLGGKFDKTSDDIEIPNIPTSSVIDLSLLTMYSPSKGQLNELSSYLWGGTFLEEIQKIYQNPMDGIISLSFSYIQPPVGNNSLIKIGNVNTGVTAPLITNQYIQFDCGSIRIDEYWGNSLDYTPYTKIQIFLPFIGYHNLNADECMDAEIFLKYNIDLLTGACIAIVYVFKTNLKSVMYQFDGNVLAQLPLSGQNMSQLTSGLFTAGVSAMAGGLVAGTAGAITAVGASTAMSIATSKSQIERAGSLVSSYGSLGYKTPYVVIMRPIQSKPDFYNNFIGYPSNITETLGVLRGFTQIEYVHLENIKATDAELTMIEELLKSGVIL